MHLTVCIATYQRPVLLEQLLTKLATQETAGLFSYSVVVADNDAVESARGVVTRLAEQFPVPLAYCVEPRRSISHVRNRTIEHSQGELIAFIDDDEFPAPAWLLNLYRALTSHTCAGILGPVRPHYPEGTPRWVRKAGFFDRPEHPTGFVMPWHECRTGNVLFRREIIAELAEPFRAEFGTGGGDVDFFRRMMANGHRFIWCNEAVVHEVVPPNRWKRSVLLKRALLRGQNSFRHPEHRASGLAKAALAVPLYALALAPLALAGHHVFMRYLVKLCDHAGRLSAAVGYRPVKKRDM